MKRKAPAPTRGRRRFMHSSLAAAGLSLGALPMSSWPTANASSRPLYLAIYRPGPAWLAGKPTNEQPLREHGRYMLQLYRNAHLKFAGGFADHSGGAAVFEAHDDESARAIVAADPAVSTGVMTCTLQRWSLVDWASLATSSQRPSNEAR